MISMRLLILGMVIFSSYNLRAQVAVSTDGSTADSSAILEIKSTTQGFLPPRMSISQRDSIVNPAPGLTIYCSDCISYCGYSGMLNVFNGTTWTDCLGNPLLRVGQSYQGGIIAYIFQPGDVGFVGCATPKGIIVAPTDQSTGAPWGCEGTLVSNTCPNRDMLGTGFDNTDCIETVCTTAGTAADICANLILGGYSDWFLPSIDELESIKQNSSIIGGFSPVKYWSSSEIGSTTARVVDFGGFDFGEPKSTSQRVRAARYF